MTKTHDSKCFDLAAHFLADIKGCTEAEHDDLAQHIQDAIEDWLSDRERAAEAAWQRHQRRDMINAFCGHLLR